MLEEEKAGIKMQKHSKAEFLKNLPENCKTHSELETFPVVSQLIPTTDTVSLSRKGHQKSQNSISTF